jgi:hypothetical protein
MASWKDITGPAYWQAATLVDSGHAIPAFGELIDTALSADFCVLPAIFYALSGGSVYLNAVGVAPIDGAYMARAGTLGYPHYVFSVGMWVPTGLTYSARILPILKYIGPVIPSRSDVRVTVSAPSAGSGVTTVFNVPGPWSAVTAIPQPSGFGASGNMTVPAVYSPSFDPMLGGSAVATLGTGAAFSPIGGVAFPYPNGPDILSGIVASAQDSSGHLVSVATITKIEVYSDFVEPFWAELLGTEQ